MAVIGELRGMAAGAETRDKREAILDAALELFAERGFHGTAVPLVAERADVAAGTIYRYFESKEALVNALYQRCKGHVAGELSGALSPTLPVRQGFRDLWRSLGRLAAGRPQALAFLELHHHAPYLDDASRAIDDALRASLHTFIARAQAEGVIKPLPPDVLIGLVWGAFMGVLRACWRDQVRLTPDVLATTEQCVWEAVRA